MKTVRNSATTWCKTRLGRIVYEIGGSTPSKERKEYWDGTIPWVSPKDMKVPRLTGTIDTVSERALRESALRLVAPGAVLLVVRGMILAHTVPVAINDVPVTLNQDMKALRPAKGVDSNFLRYRLVASQGELLGLVEQAGHGTCCLRSEHWKGLDIALPESVAQRAIADFLDRKTAAIDDLIAKKERLIELLQEKRQALITQAVTKGLDPSVSMKASNIAGVAEVPSHWTIKQIGRALIRVSAGGAPTKSTVHAEAGEGRFPAFSASGQDVWVDRATHRGEGLVLSAVGARCGKVFLAHGQWSVVANTQVFAPASGHDQRYLWHLLNMPEFWEKGGSAQPYVRVPSSLQRHWPFPPHLEQVAIAKALDMELAHQRGLEAQIQSSLALLREYRQALITNAVTGQLDIPGAA